MQDLRLFRKDMFALHNLPSSSGGKDRSQKETERPKEDADEDIERAIYQSQSSRENMIDELKVFTINSSESSSDEVAEVCLSNTSEEKPTEEWIGGKASGSIKRQKGKLSIKYGVQEIDSVNIKDYANLENAIQDANAKLFNYCRDNRLLENSYKVLDDEQGKFLVVHAGHTSFVCDFDDLKAVEDSVWKVHKTLLTVYSTSSGQKTLFQEVILNKKKVAFLDRDKLNLRRHNLI